MPKLTDDVPSVIKRLDISHRVERTMGSRPVCLYGNHLSSKTEPLRNTGRQAILQQRKPKQQTLLIPSIPSGNIEWQFI
jgi:hypothetical protein